MLPIASIVAGMFVRNPLLKMLLIGLGPQRTSDVVSHLYRHTVGYLGGTGRAGRVVLPGSIRSADFGKRSG